MILPSYAYLFEYLIRNEIRIGLKNKRKKERPTYEMQEMLGL